jgi:hypothetical protein
MVHQEELSTDFKTAILRFTDDTASDLLAATGRIGTGAGGSVASEAEKLEPRLLKETGVNIAARLFSRRSLVLIAIHEVRHKVKECLAGYRLPDR